MHRGGRSSCGRSHRGGRPVAHGAGRARRRSRCPAPRCCPDSSRATRTCCCIPTTRRTWNDQVAREPLAYRVARAVNHARDTLMAGFTTVRDLGTEGAGYADVGLKRAIEEGIIPGPRMLVAGPAMVATGSYGPKGFAPDGRCRRAPRKSTDRRRDARGARSDRPRRRLSSRCTPTIAGARTARRGPRSRSTSSRRSSRWRKQRPAGRRPRRRPRACVARSTPASRPSSTATAARTRSGS